MITHQRAALRRGGAEHATEDRGEVTVAGKADLERQRGEVVRVGQVRERAGEAKPRQVLMQRHPLDAAEQLGEIDRRGADRPSHIVEPDRVRQFGRQELLRVADQPGGLRADDRMGSRPPTEDTTEQRQHELLGLEAIGERGARGPMQQARAQELEAWTGSARANEGTRARLLAMFGDDVHTWRDGQRARAAIDGAAHAVALPALDEDDLVGVADNLIRAEMAHDDPPVGQVDHVARAEAFDLGTTLVVRLVQVNHTGTRQLDRSKH